MPAILTADRSLDAQRSNLSRADIRDSTSEAGAEGATVHAKGGDLADVRITVRPSFVSVGRTKVDAAVVVNTRFALHASKLPISLVDNEIVAMVPGPGQQHSAAARS